MCVGESRAKNGATAHAEGRGRPLPPTLSPIGRGDENSPSEPSEPSEFAPPLSEAMATGQYGPDADQGGKNGAGDSGNVERAGEFRGDHDGRGVRPNTRPPFSRWEKVARERRMRVDGLRRRQPWQGRCDGSRRRIQRAPHPQPPLPPGEGKPPRRQTQPFLSAFSLSWWARMPMAISSAASPASPQRLTAVSLFFSRSL